MDKKYYLSPKFEKVKVEFVGDNVLLVSRSDIPESPMPDITPPESPEWEW